MGERSVLLTVDWDFFVREDPTWDLGHIETPFFADFMWVARAASFASVGKDLRREMDPTRHALPRPNLFWDALQRIAHLDFSKVSRVIVGDSHLVAGVYFLDPGMMGRSARDLVVVNFDAHHDCGYKKVPPGTMTCDNWLKKILLYNPGMKAKVVYPQWKGMADWNRDRLPKSIQKRVQPGVWGHEPFTGELAGTVEQIVIARSSAWTPPFFDVEFGKFVMDIARRLNLNPFSVKDEAFQHGGITGMKGDPMVPRRFDEAEYERVRSLGASTASALEAMRKNDGVGD